VIDALALKSIELTFIEHLQPASNIRPAIFASVKIAKDHRHVDSVHNKAIAGSRLRPSTGAQLTTSILPVLIAEQYLVAISDVMLVMFYIAPVTNTHRSPYYLKNTTSSTKPEVHSMSQRRQKKIESHGNLIKFWRNEFFSYGARGQTNTQHASAVTAVSHEHSSSECIRNLLFLSLRKKCAFYSF